MTCEWCGSSRHPSNRCPTRNLVRHLTGETVDPDVPLPDIVVTMDADELFSKSEKELHDEVVNIKKLHEIHNLEETQA